VRVDRPIWPSLGLKEINGGTKGPASAFQITGSKGNLRRYRLREPKIAPA